VGEPVSAVGVFCGSSGGRRPAYAEAAVALADQLVARDLTLVYGGARVGTMGVLADRVLAGGGRVVGVIPGHLAEHEVAHQGLSELHLVDTMHERKALMAERAGAFVALPGGWGTLDEFAEIVTWSLLGLHHKPIGLLDVEGYFEHLLAWLDHAVAEGFVRPPHRALVRTGTDPARLLDDLGA